jgi:cytochrome c-type biogenesis protein CcmH
MTIWMLFTLMTAASVMAVLWPLSRHRVVEIGEDPDSRFYRDQLAEIERDRERGLISPVEAGAAEAEAARRLLRARSASGHLSHGAVGEPALRRRRAASTLALSLIPILALAIYGAHGSPHLPGLPLSARLDERSDRLDLAKALQRIEDHLAQNPQDGRGWEVVAPVYLRLGRIDDSVRAYEAALRLLGDNTARLTSYGEVLVFSKEGIVPSEARVAFEKALKADPVSPKARFYLALSAEQDGNRDKARRDFSALLASSAPDAPWVPMVKEQLARLEPAGAAAQAPDRDAILGMVEGLAERLETRGGSPEEWGRLIRSYTVLGQRDKAAGTLRQARRALEKDQAGLQKVDVMARELQLTSDGAP